MEEQIKPIGWPEDIPLPTQKEAERVVQEIEEKNKKNVRRTGKREDACRRRRSLSVVHTADIRKK